MWEPSGHNDGDFGRREDFNTPYLSSLARTRPLHNLAPFIRPICLTLATSSDSIVCKIKPWLSKNESRFYRDKQGQRGCRPFPLHPQSPPNVLRFALDNIA